MSINEAFEFYQDAGVEQEFDGFNHPDPETVEEALSTNWERFAAWEAS